MRKTTTLLALVLVAVAGAAAWHLSAPEAPTPVPVMAAPVLPAPLPPSERVAEQGPPAAQAPTTPEPAATGPQTSASAVATGAPPPAVEEVATGDTETTLESLLPRRSAGHAAGLHKTPDPLRLGSSAAMVVDARTRQVLFAKNQEAVLPMASLTKLMTGLVIAESRLPMEQLIAITDDDVDEERHSRSRLKVGTVLTRSEALHLALMSSENRAAHALGRTWPRGKVAFVAAMNAKAVALGMTNTTYVDPTGLSSGNRSSARDLTALAVAASRHEVLRDYSTSSQHLFQSDRRTLLYNNSNRLVKSPRWDISLQKTGYIVEAGHCVLMRTSIGGRDVAVVLLDAANNAARSADAERIRRWIDPSAPGPETERPKQRVTRTFKARQQAR